jgi:hypothetical protein
MLVINLTILVLAGFVGYAVISKAGTRCARRRCRVRAHP